VDGEVPFGHLAISLRDGDTQKSGSPDSGLPLVFGRIVQIYKPNLVCSPRRRAGRRGGHHLSGTTVAGRLERPTCTDEAGSLLPRWSPGPVPLGLAPRRVCRAAPVARNAGALLPHPCTPYPDGRRGGTALCCTGRRASGDWHAFPLGSTGPCGVRTFLTAVPTTYGRDATER